MTHLPQIRIKPLPPLQAKAAPALRFVLPVLGGLSGGIVAIWISMWLGLHWLELALPVFGFCTGALVVGGEN
jgi:hypothetical protein